MVIDFLFANKNEFSFHFILVHLIWKNFRFAQINISTVCPFIYLAKCAHSHTHQKHFSEFSNIVFNPLVFYVIRSICFVRCLIYDRIDQYRRKK